MLPKRILVLGGAASGKSQWAENWVKSSGLAQVYIATGRIFDNELAARVAIHRARRDDAWQEIEAPLDPGAALGQLDPGHAALIDCATMWLSNHLMEETDLAAAETRLIEALRASRATWVIVSNEVGHGIVPQNALARQFREAQGRLNIALAAEADVVLQVIAGLPRLLKGSLP
ncbi:bifunctional adenosylcobinamide kinase/adenosylcobinamide-phosphate guanylyltransferase [Sulfitobacter aestuarii]|uniref:Bifunctional adenosylcobalamin biosynthesis protein n=1 Tax=Sulfitobacter aestuarii TaxID=2161676 RepID=A0ABW5U4E9_9RHOB